MQLTFFMLQTHLLRIQHLQNLLTKLSEFDTGVFIFQRGLLPVTLLEPADVKMTKGKKENVMYLLVY